MFFLIIIKIFFAAVFWLFFIALTGETGTCRVLTGEIEAWRQPSICQNVKNVQIVILIVIFKNLKSKLVICQHHCSLTTKIDEFITKSSQNLSPHTKTKKKQNNPPTPHLNQKIWPHTPYLKKITPTYNRGKQKIWLPRTSQPHRDLNWKYYHPTDPHTNPYFGFFPQLYNMVVTVCQERGGGSVYVEKRTHNCFALAVLGEISNVFGGKTRELL